MERQPVSLDFINQLSDDALLGIFTTLLSQLAAMNNDTFDKMYKVTPFPILASGVCRRWRVLVLNTPLLWSTILIFKDKNQNRLMRQFLERSFPAMINVEFRDVEFYSNADQSLFLEAVSLISDSPRIRRLSIRIYDTVPPDAAMKALHDMDAPNLQSLDILLCGVRQYCHRDPENLMPDGSVHQAPSWRIGQHKSLRSLRISQLCLLCSFVSHNITRFDINHLAPTLSNLTLIINNLPALSSLIIRGLSDVRFTDAQIPEIIQAQQLRSLSLGFLDWSHQLPGCLCGLPYFATENLEVLEVLYSSLRANDHHEATHQRWRQLSHLKKFRILNSGDWPSDGSYFSFFSSLPNPVDLEIVGFPKALGVQYFLQIFNVPKIKSIAFEVDDSGFLDLCELINEHADPNICPVPLKLLVPETFPTTEAASSSLKVLKGLLGDTLEVIVSTGPNGAFEEKEEEEEEERAWDLSDSSYEDWDPDGYRDFEEDYYDDEYGDEEYDTDGIDETWGYDGPL